MFLNNTSYISWNAQHEHNNAAKPTPVPTREAGRAVAACPAASVESGCSSLGLWSRTTEKVGRTTRTVGATRHTLEPGTTRLCVAAGCFRGDPRMKLQFIAGYCCFLTMDIAQQQQTLQQQ